MNLNPLTEETVVSIAILGAIVGAIGAGPCADYHGRRITIMLADVVFFFGAVFMGLAPNVDFLIFGRFVVGLGVGIAAMAVPIYLAEASPPSLRGTIITINSIFITTG
jgi:MFS family permease